MELSNSPSTVEALAEAEHRRWMGDKILAGWRYGAERDDTRRLHPSMRPYEDLSDAEKQKDRATVANALATLGDHSPNTEGSGRAVDVIPSIGQEDPAAS